MKRVFLLALLLELGQLLVPAQENHTLLLRSHIEKLKSIVVKSPSGILPYDYLIPTNDLKHPEEKDRQKGVYVQQYDWDAFFEGVAFTYDGPERVKYFKSAMQNFLHFTTPAGYTPRTLSPEKFWDFPDHMKPFLVQGCYLSSKYLGDFTWLDGENYQKLQAFLSYYETHRLGSHGLYTWRSAIESGVDNNAALVNTADMSVEAVDVNSYLVREYHAMAVIARALHRDSDALAAEAKARDLTRRINEILWDPEDACYYNVWAVADEPVKRIRIKAWTSLTPLWAGVATPEQARQLIERHVLNPAEFWLRWGVPSLARSEPLYNTGRRGLIWIYVEQRRWEVSNWQGPVWIVANWQLMHGLLRYGYQPQAIELAHKITDLLENDLKATGGMHENYNGETGVGLWSANFGSWNMLVLHMVEEATQNYDPAALKQSAVKTIGCRSSWRDVHASEELTREHVKSIPQGKSVDWRSVK